MQPELFSIHKGTVTDIKEYGAFVNFDGFKGLLHITQLSKFRVDAVSDVVQVGDQIFSKVIDKIKLSIKYVNPRTGEDLDKNNVELTQESKRRRKMNEDDFRIKKIELGEVLNTNCTRCGGRGHFATDCYVQGKVYEMLEEPEPKAKRKRDKKERKPYDREKSDDRKYSATERSSKNEQRKQ